MKVFISADIEGVTGVVSWSQCGRADSNHFDFGFARRMMTHDVNAAIRGAKNAGAETIVIKDSHGNSKSLLIDELEPGVELISGHGAGIDGMMQGIDSTFQAALLVGYHGMAGSTGGIMEHTITGGIHRVSVNGEPCGEMGLAAAVAGKYGVPTVFASSDNVGCAEFEQMIVNSKTAVVKEGFGRYMGKVLHPSVTGRLIENRVEAALNDLPAINPYNFEGETRIKVEFNRAEEADMGAKLQGVDRIDAYTLELVRDDYSEAHRALWILVALSFQGTATQQ